MKPVINEGGAWEQLKDIGVFKNSLTIINNTPAWDIGGDRDEYRCLDIDPEIIRQRGEQVNGDAAGSQPAALD